MKIKGQKREEADREEPKVRLRDTLLGSALIGFMEYMEAQKHK